MHVCVLAEVTRVPLMMRRRRRRACSLLLSTHQQELFLLEKVCVSLSIMYFKVKGVPYW